MSILEAAGMPFVMGPGNHEAEWPVDDTRFFR